MYEVFPSSVSQEENWRDSVHSHDSEHTVAWAISVFFVWGNQFPHSSLVPDQARRHALF